MGTDFQPSLFVSTASGPNLFDPFDLSTQKNKIFMEKFKKERRNFVRNASSQISNPQALFRWSITYRKQFHKIQSPASL